jgi:UDP-N-acetylglucosamine--N-acetylmuramyl-(pentapeptide) pyrophosphoryl-undecaprenol N-acetylglucosamine transferase
MTSAGAAELIVDAELTPQRLVQRCGELLADQQRLARMADASRKLAKPDAAQRIAAEVLAGVTR